MRYLVDGIATSVAPASGVATAQELIRPEICGGRGHGGPTDPAQQPGVGP